MSISAQYESLLSFILFLQQKSLCQIRHRHKSTISLLHLRLLSQHFADEFLRNKVSEDMSAFDFESRDDLKLAFQCLLDSIGSNLVSLQRRDIELCIGNLFESCLDRAGAKDRDGNLGFHILQFSVITMG